MSAAQLDMLPLDLGAPTPGSPEAPLSGSAALRQQAAERLAAHRQRRARASEAAAQPHAEALRSSSHRRSPAQSPAHTPAQTKARSIAGAVAERYAQSPSYRAFLAEESQREVHRAAAAAEIAARHAEAIAQAQSDLLAELELWTAPQTFSPQTATLSEAPAVPVCATPALAPEPAATFEAPETLKPDTPAPFAPVKELSSGGFRVKLYEDLGAPAAPTFQHHLPEGIVQLDQAELDELDQEIAFRKEPVFHSFHQPSEPIEFLPGNLLEFPRQLVAAKRTRPRLAEGPLLDEAIARSPQLRIFEVDAEPATLPTQTSAAPGWSSIRLDAHTVTEPLQAADFDEAALLPSLLPPETAPLSRRFMAASVDLVVIASSFLAFAAAAAHIAGEVPRGLTAALAAAGVLPVLTLLYLLLFFSLNGQTPGMRYARIGLCTFSDENPSRAAMRRRILATIVAAAPLGLGFLWLWLDDDRLGWHDRISRMYQRAY